MTLVTELEQANRLLDEIEKKYAELQGQHEQQKITHTIYAETIIRQAKEITRLKSAINALV